MNSTHEEFGESLGELLAAAQKELPAKAADRDHEEVTPDAGGVVAEAQAAAHRHLVRPRRRVDLLVTQRIERPLVVRGL